MPFDPRIVRCDDEDSLPKAFLDATAMEEGFPAELADLATKLQADAAWLASVYPAPQHSVIDSSPAKIAPPRPRIVAHLWSRVAVASVAIAFGSAAWLSQRADGPAPAAPDFAVHPPVIADPSFPEASFPVLLPKNPTMAPAARFLWHDATGPELEGLLDLMEDDSLADSVVSL